MMVSQILYLMRTPGEVLSLTASQHQDFNNTRVASRNPLNNWKWSHKHKLQAYCWYTLSPYETVMIICNCILISSRCLQLGVQQQATWSFCSHRGRKLIISGDGTPVEFLKYSRLTQVTLQHPLFNLQKLDHRQCSPLYYFLIYFSKCKYHIFLYIVTIFVKFMRIYHICSFRM